MNKPKKSLYSKPPEIDPDVRQNLLKDLNRQEQEHSVTPIDEKTQEDLPAHPPKKAYPWEELSSQENVIQSFNLRLKKALKLKISFVSKFSTTKSQNEYLIRAIEKQVAKDFGQIQAGNLPLEDDLDTD